MSFNHNQNHTYEEIEKVLSLIHDCVEKNRYKIVINENRKENISFIEEYQLFPEEQRKILMGITVEDFCHTVKNKKREYQHEILYIFCPKVILYDVFDEECQVVVYIKFNIIKKHEECHTIVISFHKANKPVHYFFV